DRQHLDTLDVAGRAVQPVVRLAGVGVIDGGGHSADEAGDLAEFERLEDAGHLPGLDQATLDSGQVEVVDDDGLVVVELAEDGHASGGADDLLGKVVLVVARFGALGGAAATALVGAASAGPGVAGALLAEQFLGAAGHLAAAEGGVGASPLVGQEHDDDVV